MQNRRGYTCSPSPRCPVGKEGRVELSLPLRRSQANVEAEPQAAATHMTQEKAEDTLHWASSEKGGTAFSGGGGQEGCLEEGPWERALRFLQELTRHLRGPRGCSLHF